MVSNATKKTILMKIFKYILVGIHISKSKKGQLFVDQEKCDLANNKYSTRNSPVQYFFNDVKITTKDGVDLKCLYIEPNIMTTIDRNYILYLHSNDMNLMDFINNDRFFEHLLKNNFYILVLGYREYSLSKGEFTVQGVNYDIAACIDHLYKFSGGRPINIIGHQLGAAVALEFIKFINTTEKFNYMVKKIGKIALMECFSSMEYLFDEEIGVFNHFLNFFYLGASSKICQSFSYNGLENIKYLNASDVLLCHSTKNKSISYENARNFLEYFKCFHCISNNDKLKNNEINKFFGAISYFIRNTKNDAEIQKMIQLFKNREEGKCSKVPIYILK